MQEETLIPATEFCTYHRIEVSFLHSLQEYGLVEIEQRDEEIFIPANYSNRFDKVHSFRTSIELKTMQPPTAHGAIKYFSLQIAFSSRNFFENDSGVYTNKMYSEERFRYTSAKIHSPLFASLIKMGKEYRPWKKWYLDLFAGVGARYINTRYDAQNVRSISISPPREFALFGKDASGCNCDVTRFHATIGFRIMRQL